MVKQVNTCRGFVRGKIIEVEEDLDLPNGQEVSVTVEPIGGARRHLPPGEGLRRAFGGCAEEADALDEYLQWNREQRKSGRPEIAP